MTTWNDMGAGGPNKPLHQKVGGPMRKAPPVPSHRPNSPLHKQSVPHMANSPLHKRSGPPQRSAPPAGQKAKVFK